MQGFADVSTRYGMRLLKKAWQDKSLLCLDCAIYMMQPFLTLGLGVAAVLTLIAGMIPNETGIFVMTHLLDSNIWEIYAVFQFLLVPLVLMIDNKFSRKLFVVLAIYSTTYFIQPYLIDNYSIFSNIFVIGAFNVAFIGGFLLLTFLVGGKSSFKLFYRYLLYPIFILTWVPITIQGIIDKDKKEWSHTKHVRQIGIYEV